MSCHNNPMRGLVVCYEVFHDENCREPGCGKQPEGELDREHHGDPQVGCGRDGLQE